MRWFNFILHITITIVVTNCNYLIVFFVFCFALVGIFHYLGMYMHMQLPSSVRRRFLLLPIFLIAKDKHFFQAICYEPKLYPGSTNSAPVLIKASKAVL
jgi:hypothetical protein